MRGPLMKLGLAAFALGSVACTQATASVTVTEQGQPPAAQSAPPDITLLGCPPPSPSQAVPPPFRGFTIPDGATIQVPPGSASMARRLDLGTELTVEEAHRFFLAALPEDGLSVTRTEYEGFESEVFFSGEDGLEGGVWILLGCGGEGTTISIRLSEQGS